MYRELVGAFGLLAALSSTLPSQGVPIRRFTMSLAVEADSTVADSLVAAWGGAVVLKYDELRAYALPIIRVVEGDTVKTFPALRALVRSDSTPLFVGVERDLSTDLPDEPDGAMGLSTAQAIPWGITASRAPEVWARGIDGTGQTIGIMDSGIDDDHPLLTNVVGGWSGVGSWDDDISACRGHGTHTAGTAAGQGGYGMAPGAKLFALKVMTDFGGQCAAFSSTQAAAVRVATDSGYTVINASLGGGSASGTMQAAVEEGAAAGTYLSASSGNNGSSSVLYPAALNTAIAVGATSSSAGNRASYSQGGPELDIMAPGSGVVSTMPGGGTGSKSGTSMAAPHITGQIALMQHRRAQMGLPPLTLTEVLFVLAETATDKGAAGRDIWYGNGVFDAVAIDDYLLAHPVIPAPEITFERSMVMSTSALAPDTVAVTTTVDSWKLTGPEWMRLTNKTITVVGQLLTYTGTDPEVGEYAVPITWH